MTEEQAIDIIVLSLPADKQGDRGMAKGFLLKALNMIGRIPGLNFTREWVNFNLISGRAVYELGNHVLKDYDKIKNVQQMWRTDILNWPIDIVGLDSFNERTAGGDSTGSPFVGTVYLVENKPTLEIYPSPDSNYPVKVLIQKNVESIDDVPDAHKDVLIDCAITSIGALSNPSLSLELMRNGIHDVEGDSHTLWRGSTILVERPFDSNPTLKKVDSGNLR